MLRRLARSWLHRFLPPPAPPRPAALTKPEKPIQLARVFPPLPAGDRQLALERENSLSEADITSALELLRGGQARRDGARMTRPARFQIAIRQLKGFASDCLMIHSGSRIPIADMYAGYLLWAANNSQSAIAQSDFDFAMSDYLISVGGIRTERGYQGCRFRQDFVRRLEDINRQEARRRLGMGLEDLMQGKRPQQ